MSSTQALQILKRSRFIVALIAISGTAVCFSPRAFAHGALHERIAEVRSQLENRQGDLTLQIELIDLYCRHGDWREALASIDALDPAVRAGQELEFFRGQALLGTQRFAEAKTALDRFLEAHPTHSQALAVRARVHRALKATTASLADYRTALQAASVWDRDLVQEVADVLVSTDQPDEALRILLRALDKLGAFPSLLTRALALEIRLGRFDAALARIEQLEKSAPRPEPWMARRAEVLALGGRPAEAREAWEALLKHLDALPNLERGSPRVAPLAERARSALRDLPASSTATAELSESFSSTSSFTASPDSHP